MNAFCRYSLHYDGLGVRKIGTFNQVWHFGTEDTHSWRCVVAMKYGEEWGGWTSKLLQGTHVCCLWKSVRVGWDRLLQYVHFNVADGHVW